MKKFTVILDGVFNSVIEVEAENEQEAEKAAEKEFNSKILLDGEDFDITSKEVNLCQN